MNHLLKPIITEKSMGLAAQGVYTFAVARDSNKSQIREIVQTLFQVTVKSITTSKTHNPPKVTGRRRLKTRQSDSKIARVTLKKGESITLFDLKESSSKAGK